MYILSDYFLGNIKNDKLSYLEKDRFYYTNDGKHYKCRTIDKNDIYDGDLTEFYCQMPIYEWVENKHMLKPFVEKGIEHFYVKVNMDTSNKINKIEIVSPDKVKDHLLVSPLENVFLDFSERDKILKIEDNMTFISLKETINGIISEKEDIPLLRIVYNANICFPNMYYRDDVKQYVFSNSNLMTYYSDNMANQI